MFNSTHTLVGLALARAWPDPSVRYAALTAAIASNLPDIDSIVEIAGMPAYIEYHRGITHSLIGIPLLAGAFALAMYVFSGSFWRTYLLALAAMATHPLLDYLNSYGLRPFLPFNGTWYYGDALFIIDPYLDLILLAGIVAGQRFTSRRRSLTWVSVLLALTYIGGRIQLRNNARERLADFTSGVANFQKSAVLPQMLNPLIWSGIVETNDEVFTVGIDARQGVFTELPHMAKQHWSVIGEAARTKSAAAFLRFARFPVPRMEGTESGYRVTFLDFRFYREATRTALAAEVLLNPSLQVVGESLSFTKPIR